MSVALIAFKGTVGERVARLASGYTTFVVASSAERIQALCQSDILKPFDLIVGLGVYTGPGRDFVHVEQECTDADGKAYRLDVSLADDEFFKQSATIKKSWCNKLAAAVSQAYPKTRVAFLHVPGNVPVQCVATELAQKLRA